MERVSSPPGRADVEFLLFPMAGGAGVVKLRRELKASGLALSFLRSLSAGDSLMASLFMRNFWTVASRLSAEATNLSGDLKEPVDCFALEPL